MAEKVDSHWVILPASLKERGLLPEGQWKASEVWLSLSAWRCFVVVVRRRPHEIRFAESGDVGPCSRVAQGMQADRQACTCGQIVGGRKGD